MVKLQETHQTARHLPPKHYSQHSITRLYAIHRKHCPGCPARAANECLSPLVHSPQEARLSHEHDHVSLKHRSAIHTCAAHERHGLLSLCVRWVVW